MTKRRKFQYTRREANDVKQYAEEGGMEFDKPFPGVPLYKVKDGPNRIRIMPATWDGNGHYAWKIKVHYGIGPNKSTYLCPRYHNQGARCAVCDEFDVLEAEGDEKAAREIRPVTRMAVFLLDRKDRENPNGLKLWMMPASVDRDLAKLLLDDDCGTVIYIDDPDEGYDVTFEKNGVGINTKYEGKAIARRSSPAIEDEDKLDEVLDWLAENPIPSLAKVYDSDYLGRQFNGGYSAPTTRAAEPEAVDESETMLDSRSSKGSPFIEDDDDDLSGIDSGDYADEEGDDDAPEPPPAAVRRRRRS